MMTRMRTTTLLAAIGIAAGLSTGCRLGGGGSTMQHGQPATAAGSATAPDDMAGMQHGGGTAAPQQPDTRSPTDRDPKLAATLPPCSPATPYRDPAQPATEHGSPDAAHGAPAQNAPAHDGGMGQAATDSPKPADMKQMGSKMKEMGQSMKQMGSQMPANGDLTAQHADMMMKAGEMMEMGATMMEMGGMPPMGDKMKQMGGKMKQMGGMKNKGRAPTKAPAKDAPTEMPAKDMMEMGGEMMEMGGGMMEMGGGMMEMGDKGMAGAPDGAKPMDMKKAPKKKPDAKKPDTMKQDPKDAPAPQPRDGHM